MVKEARRHKPPGTGRFQLYGQPDTHKGQYQRGQDGYYQRIQGTFGKMCDAVQAEQRAGGGNNGRKPDGVVSEFGK
ncbi:hypothetical protein [Atlantibacter sp.]|uniref:hypothetical protein n=1 Tax=Atlantibacter sp. TaxID=1903473 RepID=UPI0028A7D819|nr:hypothetical protein [Atlantibacter sp.]